MRERERERNLENEGTYVAQQTLSVHLLALEEVHKFSELLLLSQDSLTLRHIQVVVRETNQ